MSGPEDTGSNDVESAAAFERWRAARYDAPDDEGDERPRRARARGLDGCRCHSASEEPCAWCSRTEDEQGEGDE